ncbi:MAG: IS91 family transposase [Hyphomicrobiaceae bacterium]|nr:IS91 family transposase [Hyphomicrobiaceae bacterium]
MSSPKLEIADIFRDHGPGWREANRGHVSLAQLKVMSAIESCRTAALGGHIVRCEDAACGFTQVAYNSCRNRHCGRCQGAASREWLEARQAELLPVPYFHVVFSLPAEIAEIAYQNKGLVYDLLFKVSADVMMTIAADPQHLGARIAITSVLHTWGSAMMHHPHVHMIVPGGGLSLAPVGTGQPKAHEEKWVRASAKFLLPVRVLSALFRRRMLEALVVAHNAGRLQFFGELANLADSQAFADHLEPLKAKRWHVYAKRPFGGPEAVLAYLARYTHRVAISSRRLIKADAAGVTFKVKDYRIDGPDRYRTMTVHPHEFIRRFLIHVLPKGFHRIRHYGLLANSEKDECLGRARELLAVKSIDPADDEQRREAERDPVANASAVYPCACPRCGARLIIIESFDGVCPPRPSRPPTHTMRVDTS